MELLNIQPASVASNRLILSFFSLLTFILIWYFHRLAREKIHARSENVRGLSFLALAFLFYAVIGVITTPLFEQGAEIPVLFSGAVNISFLLSLPFFSHGVSKMDTLATHRLWHVIASVSGVVYLSLALLNRPTNELYITDLVISSLAILAFGIFLVHDFVRKKLAFLVLVLSVSIVIVIVMPVLGPYLLDGDISAGGKYVHVNTTILAPALFLSIIAVSITFSWFSELSFREVARMYSSQQDQTVRAFLDQQLSKMDLKRHWQQLIAKDDGETVIEQMIELAEQRNESLELLLNLASRNTRNNTSKLKGTIAGEDYNLNRNQITSVLVQLIQEF